MTPEGPQLEHTWTARPVRPITALYVLVVFLVFMAVAQFVVHSREAVVALAMAAFGAVVSLIPGITSRIEYKLSDGGLAKRRIQAKESREFEDLFLWDELSHLTPTKTGFKFYKNTVGSGPLRRFIDLHFLSGHSGEFHAEEGDRERILALIQKREIPTLPPG